MMKLSFETSHCVQNPMLLLLALLTAVPAVSALVDCQTACRRCQVSADPRAVVEVYCTMCRECRWKARRRKQIGRRADIEEDVPMNVDENVDDVDYMYEDEYDNPDADLMLDQGPEELRAPGPGGRLPRGPPPPADYDEEAYYYDEPKESNSKKSKAGYYKALASLNIPEGCPTPPICSDSEPPISKLTTRTTASTSSTTTTTTTTQPPTTCPPIPECIETTKLPPSRPGRPSRRPPAYYDYGVPTQPLFPYPCMPCMPMCPCPPYPPQGQPGQVPPWPPQLPGGQQQQQQQQQQPQAQQNPPPSSPPSTPKKVKLREEITTEDEQQDEVTTTPSDFMYVYVGVPKELARQV